MNFMPTLARTEFWAKAQPVSDVTSHSILGHSLDVAAVAVRLPRPAGLRLSDAQIGFLVGLHDIGKFSRPFQAKAPQHWPSGVLGPLAGHRPPPDPHHDAMGLFLLLDPRVGQFDDVLPRGGVGARGWSYTQREILFRALAGHHGSPPAPVLQPGNAVLCDGCVSAAAAFVEMLLSVFQPEPLVRPAQSRDVVRLCWHLAGLTNLADWVGSRQSWFPYVEAVGDPAAYYHGHAWRCAENAIAEAGLSKVEAAPFRGVRGLFPGIEVPSPVQRWAETVDLPPGPVLAVVEDLTGSGKTEAALTIAHRLIADGRAGGLFFALPTMATASAMYGRLGGAYRGLFSPDATPSLALAHGRAHLDDRFVAALSSDASDTSCAAWLGDDRRRALLAHVGVGTVDQALLAALPVRFAALRLHGLAGKVLIIDEAHAYDSYMQRELVSLLEFHAALGGSVVLLSATLPRVVRQGLVDAFRRGLQVPTVALQKADYPLVTLVSADPVVTEERCAVRAGLPRTVKVTRIVTECAAVDRIIAASNDGAAVAWIRNTVDDAIQAVRLLRARGIEPILFHARFAMADRLEIEAEVLRNFGCDSHGKNRQRVLVATQVVEQSLDIDFDLMVTDLAPVDLLVQRAGRLWRHEKRVGRPLAAAELLVLSPPPVDEPDQHWLAGPFLGTSFIYQDHPMLWRSAREIFRRGKIIATDDLRTLIEVVGDSDAPGAVPPGLVISAERAKRENELHIAIAAQNCLDLWKGYKRDAGKWDRDDRTPTRLESQPTLTLRLGVVRDGVVVPYADDPDQARAWALSEINVARNRVSACTVPAGLQSAVDTAREQWTRWERDSDKLLLAVLSPDSADEYTLTVTTARGASVVARYSRSGGLSW